ncbi:hypothetical protein KKC00_03440 [Patescibacteria group bacterium]|nr:hypothetical protein [Patescibacteria group bacterium]
MNKKTVKVFSIFWLFSGLIWAVAIIRHIAVKNDITGIVIYAVAAVVSIVLAFAYYKNLVK